MFESLDAVNLVYLNFSPLNMSLAGVNFASDATYLGEKKTTQMQGHRSALARPASGVGFGLQCAGAFGYRFDLGVCVTFGAFGPRNQGKCQPFPVALCA